MTALMPLAARQRLVVWAEDVFTEVGETGASWHVGFVEKLDLTQ